MSTDTSCPRGRSTSWVKSITVWRNRPTTRWGETACHLLPVQRSHTERQRTSAHSFPELWKPNPSQMKGVMCLFKHEKQLFHPVEVERPNP